MLGGRQSVKPIANSDIYAQRANTALNTYNAELVPPATSYAGVQTPLTSRYAEPTIAPKLRAFFKDSHWRMNGLLNAWSWGAINMKPYIGSLPGEGAAGLTGVVRSSDFQTQTVRLHDWQMNRNWYIAFNGTGSGMFQGSNVIRYQYPSFRVAQINTRTSGGPGPVGMQMQPRPRFTAVQRIQKYTARPRYYDTRSAGVTRNARGGSSSTNGTGV